MLRILAPLRIRPNTLSRSVYSSRSCSWWTSLSSPVSPPPERHDHRLRQTTTITWSRRHGPPPPPSPIPAPIRFPSPLGLCSFSSLARIDDSSSSNNNNSSNHNNHDNREIVTFISLNNLSDNPGAIKKKRRVGRGIGSSKGKTCGRGHKGQKARGKVKPGFEGGQTKFYKRIPKRGFRNKAHAEPMTPVNLGTLQDFVDMGRLVPPPPPSHDDHDDSEPLTIYDLVQAGVLTRSTIKHGVKLLSHGRERLRTPLRLEVSRASAAAIRAVERVGGEVTTVHYNRLALRVLLHPAKYPDPALRPKRALPPPRLLSYYTDHAKRGYLSAEKQRQKVLRRIAREKRERGEQDNGGGNSTDETK